ncbi:hypothetical protein [Clostridium rectalis]|uniref:hypothetical protein n=1 Tax=Clostridium rectalis TaxID=2040295 RepID=UPI000F64338A|nr:hypothetical protein [Clostridium rectalis]
MKRKKTFVTIVSIVVITCICFGVYYLKNNKQKKAIASSTQGETTDMDKKEKKVVSKEKEDNKTLIDGYDITPLTKEEFYKAIEIGKKYKDIKGGVSKKRFSFNSNDDIQKTKAFVFSFDTPFTVVAEVSEKISRKYLEPNSNNVIEHLKKHYDGLNNFIAYSDVGGDEDDFIEDVHIVLKVYTKDNTEKIIQPKNVHKDKYYDIKVTKFFPESPKYQATILGAFTADEIMNLNPKELEVIIIYPNGHEAKKKFNYEKLNDL